MLDVTSSPPHNPGLQRSMKVLGTLLITLSALTPASSVFIIVPGIVVAAGSGAFLSMVLGALVCMSMALTYAELASAYPLSGGEYAIVARVVGLFPGFIVMGVVLSNSILIPAVMALGMSTYLNVLFPDLPAVPTAIVTVALTTLIGVLNIKTNAWLTGVFLIVEILALLALVALGFTHVARPFADLIAHPMMMGHGGLVHVPVASIGMASAVAIFAYNGYGSAIYFGEETHDAKHHIAKAILLALAIAVATELIPLTAVLLGAPNLKALLTSPNMLGDFILVRGGRKLNAAISLGIALAIFNAVIAVLLVAARLVYSTGRDVIWPHHISARLTRTHARYRSPWVATLTCGVLSALACLVNENVLLVVTSTGLVVVGALLCIAVIMGRKNGTTAHGLYKMPLFPAAPVIALLVMLFVLCSNWLDPVIGRPSLFATFGICIVSGLYYVLVVRRRGSWILHGPSD